MFFKNVFRSFCPLLTSHICTYKMTYLYSRTWSLDIVALPNEGPVAVLECLCGGLLAEHDVAELLIVLRTLLLPIHHHHPQ